MSSQSYPYKPLNLPHETRILTVAPGKYDDELVCSLSHISIQATSDEPYDALSYCWSKSVSHDNKIDESTVIQCGAYGKEDDGTEVKDGSNLKFKDLLDHPYYGSFYIRMGGKIPDETIKCDGVDVTVSGELIKALRQLREDETELRIWVDALCINQDDISERNEHVKTMGQIYANATRVRIWLGEEIGIEQGAYQSILDISDIMEDLIMNKGLATASLHEVQWHFNHAEKTKPLEWEMLAEFFGRAWVSIRKILLLSA
jgi:hypothetical protein